MLKINQNSFIELGKNNVEVCKIEYHIGTNEMKYIDIIESIPFEFEILNTNDKLYFIDINKMERVEKNLEYKIKSVYNINMVGNEEPFYVDKANELDDTQIFFQVVNLSDDNIRYSKLMTLYELNNYNLISKK